MQKEYQSNIWKYYLFIFFRKSMFMVPTFVLFYLDNGLNLQQIGLITTIMAAIGITLEVPSGVFADLFGRKKALTLGALFLLFGLVGRGFSHTFPMFVLTMSVVTIGAALLSGADKAFLYDSLKEIKREKEFKRIAGTAHALGLASMGIASLIGGYLATFSLRLPHLALAIPISLMLLTSLTFKEPELYKKVVRPNYFQHLKEGLVFSFTHKKVRNLILFWGFMFGLMLTSHGLFQPYMQSIGISIGSFGIFYLIYLLISAASSKGAYFIEEKLGEKKSIIIIPLILGLQFFLLGTFSFYWAFLFIFLGEFTWGFINPIISHYINQHVESSHRATVLSINAMSHKLIWAIFAPLMGWVADFWSVQTAFIAQGVVVAIVAIVILVSWRLQKT